MLNILIAAVLPIYLVCSNVVREEIKENFPRYTYRQSKRCTKNKLCYKVDSIQDFFKQTEAFYPAETGDVDKIDWAVRANVASEFILLTADIRDSRRHCRKIGAKVIRSCVRKDRTTCGGYKR